LQKSEIFELRSLLEKNDKLSASKISELTLKQKELEYKNMLLIRSNPRTASDLTVIEQVTQAQIKAQENQKKSEIENAKSQVIVTQQALMEQEIKNKKLIELQKENQIEEIKQVFIQIDLERQQLNLQNKKIKKEIKQKRSAEEEENRKKQKLLKKNRI